MTAWEIFQRKLHERAELRPRIDNDIIAVVLREIAGAADEAFEEAKREWPHRERNEHQQ